MPGRFLMAADLGERERARRLEAGRARRRRPAQPAVPNGSVGFRYGEEGKGRWNLRLGDLDPVLTLHGRHERGGRGRAAALRRRRRPGRRGDAPRRAGDPRRRPAGDDRARPDARDLRRRARRAARRLAGRATTTRARPTRRRGRRRSPASTGAWRSRSRASSPATPRSAAGAR